MGGAVKSLAHSISAPFKAAGQLLRGHGSDALKTMSHALKDDLSLGNYSAKQEQKAASQREAQIQQQAQAQAQAQQESENNQAQNRSYAETATASGYDSSTRGNASSLTHGVGIKAGNLGKRKNLSGTSYDDRLY